MSDDPIACVCTCGHTMRWHNAIVDDKLPEPSEVMRQQGEGECEANTTCKCKRFVLDHVDTISGLRGERDRLRARTHEIAEAKDQQYREAMRDHARDSMRQ